MMTVEICNENLNEWMNSGNGKEIDHVDCGSHYVKEEVVVGTQRELWVRLMHCYFSCHRSYHVVWCHIQKSSSFNMYTRKESMEYNR